MYAINSKTKKGERRINIPIRVHKLESRGKIVSHVGLLKDHLVLFLLSTGYLS